MAPIEVTSVGVPSPLVRITAGVVRLAGGGAGFASAAPRTVGGEPDRFDRRCMFEYHEIGASMSALVPYYDSDAERSRSFRTGWQEDMHAPVADRLTAERVEGVLDVGCGIGRFGTAVSGRVGWIRLYEFASPTRGLPAPPNCVLTQCGCHSPTTALAPSQCFGCSTTSMILELPLPRRDVSCSGVVFSLCRRNDPELVPHGYPRTPFDAEEAADIVAETSPRRTTESAQEALGTPRRLGS